MISFVLENRNLFIFLHVIAAVVWVGGMISMRFAAHYSFVAIVNPQDRLEKTSAALKRLFYIVMPFVLILAGTGALLTIAYGIKYTPYHYLTHLKEGIWGVMFINLVAMMIRRSKADKAMQRGDFHDARALLGMIGKYMVPVNIVLGVIAIFLGTLLRTYL
jgi:uncharacterized membrane protein